MSVARPLVLLGMMGSGKSTVARLLAERAQCPLHTVDLRIAALAGKSIPAIFAEDGEPAFRLLESEALAAALAAEPGVIDTGGGIVESEGNREMLCASAADRCYLATPLDILIKRVGDGAGRPMLAGCDIPTRLGELSRRRDRLYRAVATLVVASPSGATAVDVAARLAWETRLCDR